MTLADILSRLPRVLAARYEGDWWAKTSEMVLRLMGSNDLPYEIYDHYLFLEDSVFDYEFPGFVERVLSSHNVNETTCPMTYDKLPKIIHRQRGSFMEFESTYDASIEGITGTVSDSNDRVITHADFIGADDLVGSILEFTYGLNLGKTYYIVKHDSVAGTIQLRGKARNEVDPDGNPFELILFQKLKFIGVANDDTNNSFTIEIVDDVLSGSETIVWGASDVVIHIEYGVTTWNDILTATPSGTAWATLSVIDPLDVVLADTIDATAISAYPDSVRISAKGPDTFRTFKNAIVIRYREKINSIDSINMPFEYDDMTADTLLKGLRYYGEIQTDEESKAASLHRTEWQLSLNSFKANKAPRIGSKGRW
jgi:hypothetical protein